jgi:hypothetical protein
MCGIIIFTNKESFNQYLEWKMAARERRRKFLQKVLPYLRPAVKEDQPRAPEQVDQSPEQGTPPRYASATSLLPSRKVVE